MQKLKMTEELARELAEKFYQDMLKNTILTDSLNYKVSFGKESKGTVKINFTEEAWGKMTSLIDDFSSEVAWHGLVQRLGPTQFEIYDILVYPQVVTGATVNTDQVRYQKWLMEQPDEIFNNIRFQGHSHVSMGVTPSSVDISDQERLIENLQPEDYYIFMIWNKRQEFYARVVDVAANVSYSGKDVSVTYNGYDADSFLTHARAIVTKSVGVQAYGGAKNTSYYGNTTSYTNYQSQAKTTTAQTGATSSASKTTTQKKEENKVNDGLASKKSTTSQSSFLDDDYDDGSAGCSNLADYYRNNHEELYVYGNHSCNPYYAK